MHIVRHGSFAEGRALQCNVIIYSIYTHTHTHTHIYMYTHIHMHTYSHTCTHTHMHTQILAEVGDILPEDSKPHPPLPPIPTQTFAAEEERLPFTSRFPDEVPPEIPRRTQASQELVQDNPPLKPSATITKSLSGGDISSVYEAPTPCEPVLYYVTL